MCGQTLCTKGDGSFAAISHLGAAAWGTWWWWGDAAMPQDQAYLDWNKSYDLGVKKKNFKCQKSVLQKIQGGGGVT